MLDDRAPHFFVVGVGRSGTTLTRSMLISHPDIAIPPETGFVPWLLRLSPIWFWRGQLRRNIFLDLVFFNGRLRKAGYDRAQFDEELKRTAPPSVQSTISVLYSCLTVDQPWQGQIIGDKSPTYSRSVRLLRRRFPNAKFVWVQRDPKAVINSLRRVDWAPNDLKDLISYYRYYNQYYESDRTQSFTLSYESVVGQNVDRVAELIEYLGADPSCELDHRKYAKDVASKNLDPGIHSSLGNDVEKKPAVKLDSDIAELDCGVFYRRVRMGDRIRVWRFNAGRLGPRFHHVRQMLGRRRR